MRLNQGYGCAGRAGQRAALALAGLSCAVHGAAARAEDRSRSSSESATYVGQVAGTDAMIGLIVSGKRANAFVAGGPQSLNSLSGYFEGAVTRNSFRLTETDERGRSITGRLTSAGATGALTLKDGRAFAWSASPADSRKSAGMYLYVDRSALTGAVVTNAGRLQGVSRSLRTGRLAAATLSGALKLGDGQRVSIPGSRRGQFVGIDLVRIRNPLEGFVRLWAFQPQAAIDAARQSVIAATDSFGNQINPWDVATIPSGSDDLADIILVTDRNTHNLFAFDTCSDPPTIQLSANGVFDNIRDVDLGSQGIWVSNTHEVFNFELPDSIPTFQIPGFGIADDISFNPATGNFVVLDALDSTPAGARFDALLEIAPDGASFTELKNPLRLSDQDMNVNGARYMSAIAYGDDYLVAWTGRFGSAIDIVTAGGDQSRFAPLFSLEGVTGKIVPTDMVLFGEDVIVAAVSVGFAGGSALLQVTPDGEVSILVTAVGQYRPNGLAVERHGSDAHIVVADYQPPPPDAAHGGTDGPVGGNIVRVFLDADAELAHGVRVAQCQLGL